MCAGLCVRVSVWLSGDDTFLHRSTEHLRTWWEHCMGLDALHGLFVCIRNARVCAATINARACVRSLWTYSLLIGWEHTYMSPQVARATCFSCSPTVPQEQRRRLDWQLPLFLLTLYYINCHPRASVESDQRGDKSVYDVDPLQIRLPRSCDVDTLLFWSILIKITSARIIVYYVYM
jgi:hypothetical protein